MKITLRTISLFLTFIAIWIGLFVNSDDKRVWYSKNFENDLYIGTSLLFVTPNKYKDKKIKPQQVKGGPEIYISENGTGKRGGVTITYDYITEKNGAAFEAVRKFILDHYEGGKDIGYDLKAIVAYRAKGRGTDHSNPDFYEAWIYFVRKTGDSENLDFSKLEGSIVDKLILDGETVTHQGAFTKKLDDYFGNKILKISFLVFCLGFVFGIISIIYEKNKGG